ncbi:hypothetical protein [Profundibacter sp.]
MGKPHFLYHATARKWGLFNMVTGLLFGVLPGVFLYVNPLDNSVPDGLAKTIGALFVLGGGFAALRGFLLWRSCGVWHIEVTDEAVTYQVPARSREKGFALRLEDISHIEVQVQPPDSEAEDLRLIVEKSGAEHAFGYGENMFSPDRFMAAIEAQGIEVRRRPR